MAAERLGFIGYGEAAFHIVDWSASLDLKALFDDTEPKSYVEFAELVRRLG